MTRAIIAERLDQDTFLAQTYTRDYLHVPGAVKDPGALVSFDTLNDVISTARLESPRLRLHQDGDPIPPYRYAAPVTTRRHTVWQRVHPEDLHQRLAEGASLVVDAIDELHEPIGDLAAELEGWLRTSVQVNAYASWTATEGFGTHWDDHDVIVVQIEGSKRWKIFGPTRHKPMFRDVATPEDPPDNPVAELVLDPGDVLYLPRGWWHAVTADQGTHSLHLTCGITPHTGAALLGFMSEMLRASDVVRADLPIHAGRDEKRAYLAELAAEVMGLFDDPATMDWYAATRDAEDVGRLRPSLPYVNGVPADPDLTVRLTSGRARLRTVNDDGHELVRLAAAGNEVDFAAAAQPMLERLVGGGWWNLGDLAHASQVSVGQAAAVVTELLAAKAATVRTDTA